MQEVITEGEEHKNKSVNQERKGKTMGREENVRVFRDTEMQCKNNPNLRNAVKASTAKQKVYSSNDLIIPIDKNKYKRKAKVVVSKKRSYQAAGAYTGQEVCVHNFASATTPGGGVVEGSNAQEESLCRCSTLYFSLNAPDMWATFYVPHRMEQNPIHNDDCIYTPEVVVIKTDTENPIMLSQDQWYKVNVITCAAPNLREVPSNRMNQADGTKKGKLSDKEQLEIHEKRLTRILDIALHEGNEVVILGAFGCGAFENNPEIVARAAKNVISNYLNAFETIEFAVYCTPRDEKNFKIFESVLGNI